jgi:hypothetical protein
MDRRIGTAEYEKTDNDSDNVSEYVFARHVLLLSGRDPVHGGIRHTDTDDTDDNASGAQNQLFL